MNGRALGSLALALLCGGSLSRPAWAVDSAATPEQPHPRPVRPPSNPRRTPPAPHPDAPVLHPAAQQSVQLQPGTSQQLVRQPGSSQSPAGGTEQPATPGSSLLPSAPGRGQVLPNPLLPPRAGSAEAGALGAPVAAPGERVRVTVRAIAASREPQADGKVEFDGRLKAIDPDLRAFADQFNYRSYRLVDEQTFDLDWKSAAQMELPGSRSLQVTPRQLSGDGRIKVHLEVLGQHPEHARRLHTDYSVPRGRTILVGGYHLDPDHPEQGTLLIAITQAVEQ